MTASYPAGSGAAIMEAAAEHWPALAALFGASHTLDRCWCMWPRCGRGAFAPDAPANRDALARLVRSGNPPGLLATVGGRPAGWCAAGPRSEYPQYPDSCDPDAWAIPCLYVARWARGMGVGRGLVEAAVALALRRGARVVDGPPPWWSPEDTGGDVAGCKAVFVGCGFVEVAAGARMPVLRRRLARVHS